MINDRFRILENQICLPSKSLFLLCLTENLLQVPSREMSLYLDVERILRGSRHSQQFTMDIEELIELLKNLSVKGHSVMGRSFKALIP